MKSILTCVALLGWATFADAQCVGPNCPQNARFGRSRVLFGAPITTYSVAPVSVFQPPPVARITFGSVLPTVQAPAAVGATVTQTEVYTYSQGYDESRKASGALAVFVKTKPRLVPGILVAHVETFPVATPDQGGIVIGKWLGTGRAQHFYRVAVLPPQSNDDQIVAAASKSFSVAPGVRSSQQSFGSVGYASVGTVFSTTRVSTSAVTVHRGFRVRAAAADVAVGFRKIFHPFLTVKAARVARTV